MPPINVYYASVRLEGVESLGKLLLEQTVKHAL